MKLPTQVQATQHVLHEGLSKAINNSVLSTINRCTLLGKVAQEPDFIADLVVEFTPKLFELLTQILKPLKFSISSVFCHQKPLADIGEVISPEIGDILFVLINTDIKGNKNLNSILFQAKISANTSFKVPTSDAHQLKLYTQWPRFKYRRAGDLTGKSRDVTPKSVSTGAQYMLIDNSISQTIYPLTFPIGCAIPNSQITLHADLASELICFLTYRTGRAFADLGIMTDVWSRMIWDLLFISKSKMSRRINSGRNTFNRQNTIDYDGLSFLDTNALNRVSLFDDTRESIFSNEQQINFAFESGAPSLVVIECFETEE